MKQRVQLPLPLTAGLMVAAIAVMAALSLWSLRGMHRRLTHATATRTVLDSGRLIAAYLADQPELRRAGGGTADWRPFARLVASLHAVENGVQYVSVSSDGVTLFHEQLSGIEEPAAAGAAEGTNAAPVRLGRNIVELRGRDVPVVTFAADVNGPDGKTRTVEVAVRKDTVAREESIPAEVSISMFRLSLATVVVSFALCLLAVLWVMHRETARERERREQEHLAFAGVMANGIVHDFRNPMSALRLDLQMLQREVRQKAAVRPDRVEQLADRSRVTLDRMDRIFQEFFHLSRPPAEQPETLAVAACLRDCLDLLHPRFEQRRVVVRAELPAEDVRVRVDAVSLRRAFINVLSNAEQFSPEGGTVSVRMQRDRRDTTVEIADEGPGIPVKERKRVFEMFVTTRPGGTGLGLFLARTAVERCGGRIEVVGPAERGACVRITLPVAEGSNGK